MGGDSMTHVITQNGALINKGEWEYMVVTDEVVTNPYVGDGEPPEGWDFGVVTTHTITNPLPEGALDEDLDVFYDREGVLRLVRDAETMESESRHQAASAELAELLIDVQLGLASPEEIERAKELRAFLKESSLA